MSEQTPERLKAFRAEYQQGRGPSKALDVLQLCVLLAGFAGLFWMLSTRESLPKSAGNAPEQQRRLAAYLAEKDQPAAAVGAYEAYLAQAVLAPEARAKVCYSVAKLAIDAGRYETALRYLYESELLDGASDLTPDIDKKVLLCLDKLGRSEALRRELKRRSSIEAQDKAVAQDAIVLAEFVGESFTVADLSRELEKLPAAVRKTFVTPERKGEFLRNHVAERLLLDKARRLELDRDPEIQERLAGQLDSLIVRKLIDDEVRAKLNDTPEDIERFYKAEIDRFTRPATASGRFASGESEAQALEEAALDSANRVTLRAGRFVGETVPKDVNAVLAAAVLALKPGTISTAVEAGGKWHAFRGTLTAPRVEPFERVREQAARMYRMQKEQELVAALIEETLEARQVKLYPERLGVREEAP